MAKFLKEFLSEAVRDYGGRFWRFWIILYGATAIVELLRLEILKRLVVRLGPDPRPFSSPELVFKEFLANPLLILLAIGVLFFTMWGFAALYFSFSGRSLIKSVSDGLKNIGRYFSFVIVASAITILGFIIINVPVLNLLDAFIKIPLYLANGETINLWVALPILLFLGIPGIYFLVAFANAPFILLLEKRGIWESIWESRRRVTPQWWKVAGTLFLTFIISAIAYYILRWIIFSLKLAFVPDLSFQGELMLSAFLYSIPWVIVASFYDFVLYKVYLGFSLANQNFVPDSEKRPNPTYSEKPKSSRPFLSTQALKGIAIVTLIAFVFVFIGFPIPVQAGGGGFFGGIIGLIFGIILSVICTPCSLAVIGLYEIAFTVTMVTVLISSAITTGLDLLIGSQTCSGSYDPVFGTCTVKKTETQQIFNTVGAKFEEIIKGDIPTPEEFSKNPDAKQTVTIKWTSVGRPGLVNYMRVKDTATGSFMDASCSAYGNSCSAGIQTNTCTLPFDSSYKAGVWFAACYQIAGGRRSRHVVATCSGCGGDAVGASKEFTTSSLPLPKVDIKADGKDSAFFKAGKPITLSWTSQYALSVEAQGSWSGVLPTSGSKTVTPTSINDVYTLVVKRGDKTGSDSVSFTKPQGEIQIFNGGNLGGSGGSGSGAGDTGGTGSRSGSSVVGSGSSSSSGPVDARAGGTGGGGGGGGLRISEFNITQPLNPGDKVTISWSVQSATSCQVDNGIGKIPTVGSVQVTFIRTITFTITCSDDQGHTVSAQKTVDVKKIPPFQEIIPQ